MNKKHIYNYPGLYRLVYNSNMSVWASEAYGTSELINSLTSTKNRANLASIGTGQDLRLAAYLSDTLPYTFTIMTDLSEDSMQHKCVISDSSFFATLKRLKYDVIFSSGFFLNSLTFKNKHPTLNHLTIALRNIAKHLKPQSSIVMSTHCPKRTLTDVEHTEDSIKVNKFLLKEFEDDFLTSDTLQVRQSFKHELVDGRYRGSALIDLISGANAIKFDAPVLYTVWTGEDYIKAAIRAGLYVDFYRVDVIDSGFNTLHLSCADENEPFSHVVFGKQ